MKDETPDDSEGFFRKLWRILAKADAIIKQTDPEFHRLAMRKDIIDSIQSVAPIGVIAVFIQKILEYLFDDPRYVPIVLGIMLISGMSYRFSVGLFENYFWWKAQDFYKRLANKIEDELLAKTLSLDLGRISEPETGELKDKAERASRDTIRNLWIRKREIFEYSLSWFAALIAVLITDWKLTLVVLVPISIAEIARYNLNKRRRSAWEKDKKVSEKLKDEYRWCLTNRQVMFQARLFGMVDYLKTRYHALRKELFEKLRNLQWFEISTDWSASFIRLACSTVMVFVLVRRTLAGSMPIGSLILFVGEFAALATATLRLTRSIHQATDDIEDFEDIEKYLAVTPLIDETHATAISLSETPKICVREVTFMHANSTDLALSGCTFDIEPGEKLALIGTNGSGKTTIANLIAKLNLPKEGHIKIGDIPLERITQESWVKHLLYVTWQVAVPDFPIDEVVAGVGKEEIDVDRLLEAAKITGVHDFVKSLPWKYGTPIGTTFPGGRNFSTGQLQRIRLAAGVYRLLDPEVRVAIFDEPMANCDHTIREKFYGSIRSFEHKTVLVIAHDPTYLHHFDRIVVMDKGKVVDDIRGIDSINAYKMQIVMRLSADL